VYQALEHYRTEFGDYPPDFVGTASSYADAVRVPARNAVVRHLRKRFPRCTISGNTVDAQFNNFVQAVASATSDYNEDGTLGDGPGIDISSMTPSQALVFWIGGLPAYAGSNELTRFSANPSNPIAPRSIVASRTPLLLELSVTRLFRALNAGNVSEPLSYGEGTAQGSNFLFPVCYFMPFGNPYGSVVPGNNNFNWYLGAFESGNFTGTPAAFAILTMARPYADSGTNNRWMDSGKPQVIAAGLDGDFGTISSGWVPRFPSGANFTGDGNNDNVASFLERATINDDIKAQQ
jgi:hypothetical protein